MSDAVPEGPPLSPLAGQDLGERAGQLVIPAGGTSLTDEDVEELRDADQR